MSVSILFLLHELFVSKFYVYFFPIWQHTFLFIQNPAYSWPQEYFVFQNTMTAQSIIDRLFGEYQEEFEADHRLNRFGFGATVYLREEDHNRALEFANSSFNSLLKTTICTNSTAEQRATYLKQESLETTFTPVATEDISGLPPTSFSFIRTTTFPRELSPENFSPSTSTHTFNSIRIVWNRELRPPKIRDAEPKILDYLSKTYSINRTLEAFPLPFCGIPLVLLCFQYDIL